MKNINWRQLSTLDEDTKAYLREQSGKYVPAFNWALDFIRAYRERPRLLRHIARLCMGRYAYRELNGLYEALKYAGYYPDLPYDCQRQEYHQEVHHDL